MYDELYEAWTRERATVEVQALPTDFFVRLAQYGKKLRAESRMLDEKTVRAKLLLHERKNVRKLTDELIRLRYKKVLKKVMAGEILSTENLTGEEEKIYRETATIVESYQDLLNSVLYGRSTAGRVAEEETTVRVRSQKRVLRFLQKTPAIIGVDMKTYGPFLPEDVASLPAENAKVLVKQGVAVEVETKL